MVGFGEYSRRGDEHQRRIDSRPSEPHLPHWVMSYAKGVILLGKDHAFAGAESVFNQALTSGLLAIANSEKPSLLAPAHLPPARRLTKELTQVPEVDEQGLIEAIDRTDGARHGRRSGHLLINTDVDLLRRLDGHPALRLVTTVKIDDLWTNAERTDQQEHERSAAYLRLLDEHEIQRRIEAAQESLEPTPGDVYEDPQECDCCGHLSMNCEGPDDFGHGFTAGTCLVCSFRRSDQTAYGYGMDAEIRRQIANDD